jgi:MFS family permease
MRQLQTFGIFAAGYLARPIGGVLMAHFGDLVGRKRMFMLSVLLMSVPTLLIGLLPTYAAIGLAAPALLLLMRILQGAAVGGEVPGAWVFVSEHVPDTRIGLACGVLTTGLTVGILLGSLMANAVHAFWTPDEVLAGYWRLPFIIGGVFGLFALWLRRYLHETPVFKEMQRRRSLVAGLPIRQVLDDHRASVVRSMIFSWLLTAGIVIVILMTPTLAQTAYGIPVEQALRANSFATLGLSFGCILFGMAADRFGAPRVVLWGSLAMLGCTLILFQTLAHAPEYFMPAYILAGVSVGVVGVVPAIMVRAFPPPIRFSGISFSYNVAYALSGGLTPLIVTMWMQSNVGAAAYYVGVVALIAAVTAARMPLDTSSKQREFTIASE